MRWTLRVTVMTAAMTLEPGDVVSTGSPSGVSPLKPGDLMEGEVERVGYIRNQIVADPAPGLARCIGAQARLRRGGAPARIASHALCDGGRPPSPGSR